MKPSTESQPFHSMLDELEDFSSTFFEANPKANETECTAALQNKARQFVESLTKPAVDAKLSERALYHLQAGRLLNVSIEYDDECELQLEKAIKLDPDLHEAWLEYGALLAKQDKPDLDNIILFYETSLEVCQSAKALAYLSVALRSKINTSAKSMSTADIKAMRTRSILCAEEAVKLEPSSSIANFCLGNSLMIRFFLAQQNEHALLTRAIDSFYTALECSRGARDPNIHLNLATCLRYQENYSDAVKHLNAACKFDPCNSLGSVDRREMLTNYIRKVADIYVKKGKLKPKRLKELCDSLLYSNDTPPSSTHSLKSAHNISNLSLGENKGLYLTAKVIATVHHEETVPLTTVIADRTQECAVLTLYNAAPAYGFVIGDVVCIAEPHLIETKDLILDTSSSNAQPLSFRSIRVSSPTLLSRNGVVPKQLAPTTVSVSSK